MDYPESGAIEPTQRCHCKLTAVFIVAAVEPTDPALTARWRWPSCDVHLAFAVLSLHAEHPSCTLYVKILPHPEDHAERVETLIG